MRDQPVASRRAAERLIGLVHHVGQGELFNEVEPALRDHLREVAFHDLPGGDVHAGDDGTVDRAVQAGRTGLAPSAAH